MALLSGAQLQFLLNGLAWTLALSLLAFAGGGLLGFAVALARAYGTPALRRAVGLYIQLIQGTPLLVVLGHESCGAVAAAIDEKFHGGTHRTRISLLLRDLMPSLEGLDTSLSPEAQVEAGVEANVRAMVRQLVESPELKARAAAGDDRRVVGAVVQLATGHVRFLD